MLTKNFANHTKWTKRRKRNNIMSVSCKLSRKFYSTGHVCHWRHCSWASKVLCPSFRYDIRKKKKKICIFCLSDNKKNKLCIGNSLCICLRDSKSVCYTSNTYSVNSSSSFANYSNIISNVVATLLFFWISYITYPA